MKSQKIMFLLVMGFLLLNPGCAHQITKKDDPSSNWTLCWKPDPIYNNEMVEQDYKDYVNKLSTDERRAIDPLSITFSKSNTGCYAVHIRIPLNGASWEHVIIYNQKYQRVKAIKYIAGYYGI